MAANMWRGSESSVRKSGKYGVVLDCGVMRRCGKSNRPPHYYVFTEDSAIGVRPLVLIGTVNEIFEFLMINKTSGIENRIASIPDIYMKASQYRPGKRYVGLFPGLDAAKQLTDNIVGLIGAGIGNLFSGPMHSILEISGGAKDLKQALDDGKDPYGKAFSSTKGKSVPTPNQFAITWHYLQEKGSEKIGEGSISFASQYGYVEQKLLKLLGIY
jgi:hypothetical protein